MDSHLLFLINLTWTNPVLDRVLGILSCMEFWIPILGLGSVWMVWRYRGRGLRCLLFCFLAVLGNEELISQPLKRWTARPRPHQSFEGIRRVDMAAVRPRLLGAFSPMQVSFSPTPNPDEPNKRSFPSSHTLNATTLGLVFALFFSARAWLLLPFLMAWSRVYTGAHWPSDVTASILIGLAFTGMLLAVAERLWARRMALRASDSPGSTFLLHPDALAFLSARSVKQ